MKYYCEHRLEKSKMKSKHCCKACYGKQYRKDNAEAIKLQKKKYYKDNAEARKQYRIDNADARKQYDKQYRKDNAEAIKLQKKKYRKDNAEAIKQYYKDNADYYKQYRKDNAEAIKQYRKDNAEARKQYMNNRRKTDSLFRMIGNIRNRLRQYSKLKHNRTTFDLVGCSPAYLHDWLEGQFKAGMTWQNQGQWHIDHILPLSMAETDSDFAILAHYTNLQPLWAEDNLKKGNR